MARRGPRVRYFKGSNGRWYWTVRSGNYEPVATEAEGDGYATKWEARRAFRSARRAVAGATEDG